MSVCQCEECVAKREKVAAGEVTEQMMAGTVAAEAAEDMVVEGWAGEKDGAAFVAEIMAKLYPDGLAEDQYTDFLTIAQALGRCIDVANGEVAPIMAYRELAAVAINGMVREKKEMEEGPICDPT